MVSNYPYDVSKYIRKKICRINSKSLKFDRKQLCSAEERNYKKGRENRNKVKTNF